MSPTPSLPGNDSLPVEDGEYLLRRFPNEPDKFDFSLQIPRLNIFLPSNEDVEGLSLNREGESFTNAEQVLASATSEKIRSSGGVVAVLTGAVRENGMTVIPSPADSPGHVIIPEMNRTEYDRKEADGSRPGKQKIKELADRLARIAQIRIAPKPKS